MVDRSFVAIQYTDKAFHIFSTLLYKTDEVDLVIGQLGQQTFVFRVGGGTVREKILQS